MSTDPAGGPPPPIAPALESAIRTGDYALVARLFDPRVRLDSSSEAGRVTLSGAEEVSRHLSAPGPGELLHWQVEEWSTGLAASFEWRGASLDRRRWYVRRDAESGAIVAIWSYAARARAGGADQIPQGVLEQLGPGARRASLEHGGNSGAALERVHLPDGHTLIAKRVGPASDWLGRVTGDMGRTALLWEAGAFDRMPPELDAGIETVIADGEGAWWVLMRDLSATFLGDERRLSRAESARILRAAAAMHAEFEGNVPNGAAALRDRLAMSSLAIADAEREGTDLLPKQIEAAWDAFSDSADPDVAAEILAAVRDPAPLAAALEEAAPVTLLHGDLRDDNLGLTPERIVLLDWDLATAGTPTVEFAWYLLHDAWRIDATHDEIEADYVAAEGERLRSRELELGLLTGLVQYGWIIGHSLRVHPDPAEGEWAREELDWWQARTRAALERTGGMPQS